MWLAPEFDFDFGFCPFALATNQPCILCGGTRAARALAAGQISEAWAFNASVVVLAFCIPSVLLFQGIIWRTALIDRYRRGLIWIQSGTRNPNLTLLSVFSVWWIWNIFRW